MTLSPLPSQKKPTRMGTDTGAIVAPANSGVAA